MRWSFQNYIMLKSSRKKLIAIGCSFTEHYLTSDQSPNLNFDFPRWPQHLADMLDMECVNLGKAGAGNDYILAKTVDATLKEKNIGLVVLMWSEWRRMGFQCHTDWNKWTHITENTERRPAPGVPVGYLKKFILEKQNPPHATRNTLRTFIHAEKILRDIPYMFLQGTQNVVFRRSPTAQGSIRETANEILKSPYLDYIENNISDKFIGWPLMKEIGGYCIDDILNKEEPLHYRYRGTLRYYVSTFGGDKKDPPKFRISDQDMHPNDEGHKFIAEFLYEQYKEIYNVKIF